VTRWPWSKALRARGQNDLYNDCNWARRRLCDSLVGDCLGGEYAISAARSRAAATINLARAILALVLWILFLGGSKSC
jgi:hypothetical protein